MSSTVSSDEYIKNEIIEEINEVGRIKLRIFCEGSNQDQLLFSEGGLTFADEFLTYGSCDAVWYETLTDANGLSYDHPVVALEGTDALSRNSSGNAQYQRFHHALGAVRNNIVGVYYLKAGNHKVRDDLYNMAATASRQTGNYYIVTQSLQEVKHLLEIIDQFGYLSPQMVEFLDKKLTEMETIFSQGFLKRYNGDWEKFAEKRSTLIYDKYIIKHAGRMKRNFTDSSQRAGHIAVGEMYLSSYSFPEKHVFYLFAKMTNQDFQDLDVSKSNDKEWNLLRNEPNVTLLARDDLVNLPSDINLTLKHIENEPLKGEALTKYNQCLSRIMSLIESGEIHIPKIQSLLESNK